MVIYSTFQSNISAFATAMGARHLQRKINSKKKLKNDEKGAEMKRETAKLHSKS
jgi:hypothetical protein